MKDVHFEWHLFLSSLLFEEGVSTNAVNKEKVSYINSRLFFKELRKNISQHISHHTLKTLLFFFLLSTSHKIKLKCKGYTIPYYGMK